MPIIEEKTNIKNIENSLFNIDLGLPITNNVENINNLGGTTMKTALTNSVVEIKYTYSANIDGSINASIYVSNNSTKNLMNVNLKFMVLRTVQLKVISTSGNTLGPLQKLGIQKVKFNKIGFFYD